MSEWVSRFLTAELGYTVPFTLVHAGKYRTEDRLKTDDTETNTMQNKQTTQNTAKQNYPGSVASYDTRPGNEFILQCSCPELTWGVQMDKLTLIK